MVPLLHRNPQHTVGLHTMQAQTELLTHQQTRNGGQTWLARETDTVGCDYVVKTGNFYLGLFGGVVNASALGADPERGVGSNPTAVIFFCNCVLPFSLLSGHPRHFINELMHCFLLHSHKGTVTGNTNSHNLTRI